MIWRNAVAALTLVMVAGCSIVSDNQAGSLDEKVSIVDMIKVGDAKVCGVQETYDNLTARFIPEGRDFSKVVEVHYSLPTASNIDKSVNKIECEVTVEIKNNLGSSLVQDRQFRIPFSWQLLADGSDSAAMSVNVSAIEDHLAEIAMLVLMQRDAEQREVGQEQADDLADHDSNVDAVDHVNAIDNLSESQRRSVFLKTIRDADFACMEVSNVERVQNAEEATWQVSCSQGTTHLVTVQQNGDAQVFPHNGGSI
ncbi:MULTISPECIES: hypothetical protein [unclassified Sphingobium]|uniref:hypothetical protein n=1 Tax=unclassified Sphingobium TaxID=2611147 RepID=UPI0022253A28|nr:MULTISPECIES: hypothetical protein [unclassified Sphingobium]MCW2396170.1 hypothetical protein [Sphingobium sp. B8D3B]MCW2419686.1 hypothetical protein [Sphingobium sp. B8D3C]